MSDQPRRISHFHLGNMVHEGEKSELYEARYTHSGGVVQSAALKLLKPRLACIGDELRAYLRELNWARDLRSSILPRVLEAGEQGGNYFLAMELVEGWTLAELLRSLAVLQAPLPCQVGLTIAYKLAEGVLQIHSFTADDSADDDGPLGVVHLGIEPENIMLRTSGAIVLLDLGATRSARSGKTIDPGETVGAYNAPEFLRMLPVDGRADIYSLGRVLDDLGRAMLPAELGEDLVALIARASHVHAEERFASVADLVTALELVARNRGFEISESACQHFVREVFGQDDKRTDPRARRPQSVAPFAMQSEGLQTAFSSPQDPLSVEESGAGDLRYEGFATAIGAGDSMTTTPGDGLETVLGGPDAGTAQAAAAGGIAAAFEMEEATLQSQRPECGDEERANPPVKRNRFIDQHLAVTVLGPPAMLAEMAVSEENTVVVSQESLAASRFPEELIPTKNNRESEDSDEVDES